ncbi:MAG: DNA alkylation repair protein [Caldilineaceae bacterium]|nr:DNA alkylation repair protein [Caldilineaceae bacterium]MCB0126547.1 DNA alkylation repair protein [Caldilineaceae bacterium]
MNSKTVDGINNDPSRLAAQIMAEIRALSAPSTTTVRAVRRQYSKQLTQVDAAFMRKVAHALIEQFDQRWLAYELVRYHKGAFRALGAAEVEALGQGIHSWDTVDAFARILAGPAWLHGQLADATIQQWALSTDRWWRRTALVSTVALNMRSQGGQGDVSRTLAICELLVADHEDMVVKALSWALRELIVHDAGAVETFLATHEGALAARVKREVRNKLTTGLKNP